MPARRSVAAMAPCVLWLDEIEKGLATGDDATDGGVSRRVLGAFLTWTSKRDAREEIDALRRWVAVRTVEVD